MPSSKHNQIFVVVGMHRSGTSLVTQCLNGMGLELTENLIPPSIDNPLGFFEDAEIVRINTLIEKALEIEHMSLSSILPLPEGWVESEKIKGLIADLKKYLLFLQKAGKGFVIKDPRVCRLLPLYISLMEEIGLKPVFFFVYRTPQSVVRSKTQRDLLPEAIVLEHWKRSNIDALSSIFSSRKQVCFVSYDDLVCDPDTIGSKISSFLGSVSPLQIVPFPSSLVVSKGYANKLAIDRKACKLDLLSRDLYKFLKNVGNVVYDNYDVPQSFIDIETRFTTRPKYKNLVLNYLLENRSALNSVADIERKLVRSEKKLRLTNGELFGARERLESLGPEVKKLRSDLQEKKFQLTQLHSVLEKHKAELKAKDNQLDGVSTQLKTKESQLKTKESQLQTKEFQLKKEQEKIKALGDSHVRLEQELDIFHRKHKTKIFILANLLQSIKTKHIIRPLLLLKSAFRNRLVEARSVLILVRRSLNANGFKRTVTLIINRFLAFFSRNTAITVIAPSDLPLTQVRQVDKAISEVYPALLTEQKEWIKALFVAEYYLHKANLDIGTEYVEALKHFLSFGMKNDISPGPMFSTGFCRQVMGLNCQANCFLQWLTVGAEARINPSPIFDEAYFSSQVKMQDRDDEWSFSRFVRISVYNNASPNQYFDSNWYAKNHDITNDSGLPGLYHYLLIGFKKGWRPSPMFPAFSRQYCESASESPMETVMQRNSFLSYRNRMQQGGLLSDLVEKAAVLEPEVKGSHAPRRLNIQPFSNPYFPAVSEMRSLLKCENYDSIVLIPHCRYGGSGLVAGELCRSLGRIEPDGNLLLVRTDHDDFMRPDWFPPNIEIINLRDFGVDMPDIHRRKLLIDLLIGTKPKRIINVHSRLAWEVFVSHGDRLSKWSNLIGYTFCYDVSITGRKVGYPVKYVPSAFPYLERLFIDNNYLKDDLLRTSLKEEDSDKLVVLPTPYNKIVPPVVSKSKNSASRKQIFWAGRFDRQKKFELVLGLAKRNPGFDFHVWGASMLGDQGSLPASTDNVKYHGLFSSYEEIPFRNCDIWLYTSLWDGVPTILIELALREVPIVASRIWGTADLIDESTAWPVDEVGNEAAYQLMLLEALTKTREAKIRAKNLRNLVLKRHSQENFDARLRVELAHESSSDA